MRKVIYPQTHQDMLRLKVIFCTLSFLIPHVLSLSILPLTPHVYTIHDQMYFAMRLDNKQGVCLSPFANDLSPIYDVSETIANEGFRWDASLAWRLSGLEPRTIKANANFPPTGDTYVISNGNENFQFLDEESFFDIRRNPGVIILAANATLLFTGSKTWQGNRGTLLEIDHLNPETNVKETRVRVCHDVSSQQEGTCGTIFHQVGTNFLQDGKNYVPFLFEKRERCNPDGRCAHKYLRHPFKWYQRGAKQDFVFVKSHNTPGVFIDQKKLSITPMTGRASNKMGKRFTQSSKGSLVVNVVWNELSNMNEDLKIEAKKYGSNRLVHASRQSKISNGAFTKVEFDQLEPGDYKLTLYNITEPIRNIYLCSSNVCAGEDNLILNLRVVGCRKLLFVNSYDFLEQQSKMVTIDDSSKCNLNVSPHWQADDWSYLCSKLGIKNTAINSVNVKLCNKDGCAVTACPYGRMQPPLICPEASSMG